MQHHELTRFYRPLSEHEQAALTESIRLHGQMEEVTLFEGKVLDGRGILAACQTIGCKPRFRAFKETNEVNALAFLKGRNADRRHLTKEDLLVSAVEMHAHLRMPPGQRRPKGSGKAVNLAATQFGVSPMLLKEALTVAKEDPKLWERVKAGELPVGTAYHQVKGLAGNRRGKKGKMPIRLVSEYDAIRERQKMTRRGWTVSTLEREGSCKVQFVRVESDLRPWPQVPEFKSVRSAIQGALDELYNQEAKE